jgi:hypothetical protein
VAGTWGNVSEQRFSDGPEEPGDPLEEELKDEPEEKGGPGAVPQRASIISGYSRKSGDSVPKPEG